MFDTNLNNIVVTVFCKKLKTDFLTKTEVVTVKIFLNNSSQLYVDFKHIFLCKTGQNWFGGLDATEMQTFTINHLLEFGVP